MKTIPYTRIDAVIKMMPDSDDLRNYLINRHALDILLQRDIEIIDNDYQYLAKNLPLDAVCVLMRESLIDALNDIKQNREKHPSIYACLLELRENEMILVPTYIALRRLLQGKTIDKLLNELENTKR